MLLLPEPYRVVMERRGKKRVREFALAEYDGMYHGKCEACARQADRCLCAQRT